MAAWYALTLSAVTAFSAQDSPRFGGLGDWSPALEQKVLAVRTPFVAIQVWNPFCEPCTEEVSELNTALMNANQTERRLTVLGIPVQGRTQEIQAFIDHFRPQYEQWMPDRAFTEAFPQIGAVPLTLLYRKDGQLLRQWRGKVTSKELLAAITEADAAKKGKP